MKPLKVVIFVIAAAISLQANAQLQTQNTSAGMPNFFDKADKGSELNVVFFGGSITNHNGYRVLTTEWLKQRYPKSKITSINAGVGGTGCDLGVFRMDNDVMKYNPDLVFVEFAVNNLTTDSLTVSNSMEGIVRKIRRQFPQADICFLYTASIVMLPDMANGKVYKSARLMENVAKYYNLPSVNFAAEAQRLIAKDSLIFKGDKSHRPEGKITLTDDGTHPTMDQGHPLYASILTKSIENLRKNGVKAKTYKLPQPLYPTNYEKAKCVSLSDVKVVGNWYKVSQDDEMFKKFNGNKQAFPELIASDDPAAYIEIKFNGVIAGIYDLIGPPSGDFTYTIDGGKPQTVRRFDAYCGSFARGHYKLLPTLADGPHTIVIRPDNTRFDKQQVYAKRGGSITDMTLFEPYRVYIGQVLLIGDLIK